MVISNLDDMEMIRISDSYKDINLGLSSKLESIPVDQY